ncbi:MBL fold metallo-hydrolase [Acetivibrio cellulolyticus]|uniref:MBL fold metallo-hydrolase n=1 Tax=Acetivibrio cellulolyticus TaxID=35830 RepID=UPI0001E2C7CC|nr:MBL fold metallo-hydrolase [Acetivibrio cellulolyticus]
MKRLLSTLLFIVLFLNLTGCAPKTDLKTNPTSQQLQTTTSSSPSQIEEPVTEIPRALATSTAKPSEQTALPDSTAVNGQLRVHFIDVGQADSILIQTPENKAMLIDAGENDDGNLVTSYIKSQGINKISVVVGTHPHEDHLGGLDTVINNFSIEKIYMPKVSSKSDAFEDVWAAIRNKGLTVTTAKAGVNVNFDSTLKTEILAPNKDSYDDINNYSAVIKMTYNNTSFLFTGDSESISEKEMLSAGIDLKADVLKVGHHGSGYSTGALFLKKVSPKYAVISVGENNNYNHPDNLILNRLKTYGVELFRTDKSGTIVATSDGNTIKFDKKASPVKSQAPPEKTQDNRVTDTVSTDNSKKQTASVEKKEITVYVTKSGDKYHTESCQYLKKSKISISLDDAKSQGFTSCSKCHPPQ